MIYLPLRLGISVFAAILIGLFPALALPPRTELMARWGIPVPTGRLADLFLTPWLRFDALWFLKTALHGYELSEPNIHHMPLYLALMRLLQEIIGGHIALSALIISNVAFILALGYFYRLVRLDDGDSIAWRATVYLAIFPIAFFYLLGYPESLFLLGSVGAFYYARQRAWFRAGLLGTISTLARPQGLLILLPLALEFLQLPRDSWRHRWREALPLLLVPLAAALYALYLHITFGLRTAIEAFSNYWHIPMNDAIPGQSLWLGALAVLRGIYPISNGIDLAFALFGLAMTVWAICALRSPYWLFMSLNMLVFMSKLIPEYPLQSIPRYIIPLFPMYVLLGRAGEASPITNRLIVYSWLALSLFFSAQFALGGWVA